MTRPARSMIQSPLGRFDYHIPALRKHVEGPKGLQERLNSGEGEIRKADSDVLDHVLGMPTEFLPKQAYPKAEKLQGGPSSTATEEARQEHLKKLHEFLGNVLKTAETTKGHYLQVVRTGERPQDLDETEGKTLYQVALKRRQRLAQLMHRYISSGLWSRTTIPSPEIRTLWRQWVREGLITPESRQQVLSRNERHGMDPNTLLTRLSERAGIHRDELEIMRKWSYETLSKIVGKQLPGEGYR
ncbi:hypothetical protein HY994_06530 [Candidatus Micrarchaeota archaeon]|nr:hypothetical protein [Candidatus Micrarchaeota archaeon]